MKTAKFYVDWLFEAGSFDNGYGGNVCHRYWFESKLSDEEFEELYQVWFANNSELNSWDTDWTDHEDLFNKINSNASYALNELLKKHEPELGGPADILWEISQETQDAF